MDPLNDEHVEATREMTKALADMIYGHDPILMLAQGASIDEAMATLRGQQDANERFHAAAAKVWAFETGEGETDDEHVDDIRRAKES